MFYHGSDKKRHKGHVRKVAFTLQFLGDRTNFSFTAHVISEIVTQTDVRIMAPKQEKTRVRTHPPPPKHGTDCLHGLKCEVRTPFLTLVRTRFFCCVNGLLVSELLRAVHPNADFYGLEWKSPDIFIDRRCNLYIKLIKQGKVNALIPFNF